jgi:type II secretory pathway component PulF
MNSDNCQEIRTMTEAHENSLRTLQLVAGTVGVLLSHLIALTVLIGVLVGAMPRYEMFCKDWNLQLPDTTIFTLSLSAWMTSYWPLPLLGLVPDGIVYFLLARLKPRINWCAAAWAVVPLLFTILLLGAVAAGMCLPLLPLSPSQQHTVAPIHGETP